MTKRFGKILIVVALFVLMMVVGGVLAARRYYFNNLEAVSSSQNTVTVTIPTGSSLGEVADILHGKKLIRNTWAFRQYVRNKGLQDNIQPPQDQNQR